MIADNEFQVFGRSLVKRIESREASHCCYRILAIHGGSEAILADAAVREQIAFLDANIENGGQTASSAFPILPRAAYGWEIILDFVLSMEASVTCMECYSIGY